MSFTATSSCWTWAVRFLPIVMCPCHTSTVISVSAGGEVDDETSLWCNKLEEHKVCKLLHAASVAMHHITQKHFLFQSELHNSRFTHLKVWSDCPFLSIWHLILCSGGLHSWNTVGSTFVSTDLPSPASRAGCLVVQRLVCALITSCRAHACSLPHSAVHYNALWFCEGDTCTYIQRSMSVVDNLFLFY